ncbi:NAD(P)-binding protein [Xylona heveae TC161]|uniref:NAD(P)-binding protein n=1 Tax=Xylona heveae (strain CBS 132557 / TC161) TaxID=1328760 RepID=A0A165JS48_XYLHT|nr:NAD(P)-binding protein [Xylona heveae TC161]KZF26558.1 NAD(P)-binding protein [Xylona heveae TC161]
MAVNVALIGSGIFAREQHLPAITASSNITLKAIYSRTLASAQNVASGAETPVDLYSEDGDPSRNYVNLLSRADIHAVIIALPITHQPEYIRLALLNGKHVLSEKPVAKDVASARELIKWYHSAMDTFKVTWSVAENYRYIESFLYAAQAVKELGRVLGFRVKVHNFVKPGTKYFGIPSLLFLLLMYSFTKYFCDPPYANNYMIEETAWRKTPEYQGGFLLDGGVHFVAGTRLLLSEENAIMRVSAFSAQLQPHLPPVDTLDAVLRTKTGVTGTWSVSFGTSLTGNQYTVACDNGTVTAGRGYVVVTRDGKEERKEFPNEGSGVKQEVHAWATGILEGKQDPRQTPHEALRDLEILEKMLRSGESAGTPQDIIL